MYIVQLYKEDWGILHMLGCSSPQYQADSVMLLSAYPYVNPSQFDEQGNPLVDTVKIGPY